MNFADQLQAAKGDLTAKQVAAAVSPLLSVRTVEKWLAAENAPPIWAQRWILDQAAKKPISRQRKYQILKARQKCCQTCGAPAKGTRCEQCKARAKSARQGKGQNDSSAGTAD